MGGRSHGPGVWFPPPLLFVVPFLASFWLERRWPWRLVGTDDGPVLLQAAGAILAAAGFGLMFWALTRFLLARTSPLPHHEARHFVVIPPYTFSRNPMYVGMIAAYLGGAAVTNWAWPLVWLPVTLAVVRGYVIAREERYLRATFGEAYIDYCRRVRRWL